MVLLITVSKAQRKLTENIRERRLRMQLTQEGLAQRSGVPLPTIRKFEQKGVISLESFLKILLIVGGLEEIVEASKPVQPTFTSIDEVLKEDDHSMRKRGRHK